MFSTLHEISNDPPEECSAQGVGTSRGALAAGTALTGFPFIGAAFNGISVLGIMFAQAQNLFPPDLEEVFEFLDLEQNF